MNKVSSIRTAGITAIIAGALAPAAVYAQTQQTLGSLIKVVVDYITQGLFLIMAVAVLIFVIQVIRYFILPNENRKEAGQYVMYSIIGFFVIFSLWGLVSVVSQTFGVGDNKSNAPQNWANIKAIFPSSTTP